MPLLFSPSYKWLLKISHAKRQKFQFSCRKPGAADWIFCALCKPFSMLNNDLAHDSTTPQEVNSATFILPPLALVPNLSASSVLLSSPCEFPF